MIHWQSFLGAQEPSLLDGVERLRREVWLAAATPSDSSDSFEAELTAAIQIDALDEMATHVVCLDTAGGRPQVVAASQVSLHASIGTVRDASHYAPFMADESWPAAVFNRLVVLPRLRGRGIARRMDRIREARAQRWGACSVWTEARGSRVHAMQDAGFVIAGHSPDRRYPGEWCIMGKVLCSVCDARHTVTAPSSVGFAT